MADDLIWKLFTRLLEETEQEALFLDFCFEVMHSLIDRALTTARKI